ncbi:MULTISPECIES: translation initiation factor IF-2 [Bacillus]|uniref:Translation initiation factor IF-2 n=1 Tax=Bacillus amyloliquefaciens (strain ATCC 23350 / DSM 7 / BCRC 11601 / CCUG 28519 / NBRC 15535 / NRRL B-14393 / F) TaxID=692420 RepID=A0A9P1NHD9_BACAS|nr:translation initiation factor IF-2 [Bacillus amyloliquefaciens]AIW33666.1 translation initiation factor IF-2 [Bacillus subtilis]AEB23934.1 translation initiation factor IF-2 [Bacillus amyloliquefaciens TA208]AEB63363.1 initiation factor IF-2 [Bacillus amyloliquefaciens LL3]AEK88930.1 translation initiation factor IF-2 [Bacillus amyloliquefaciens XH7]ARW38939.1 Translation initiation factor IF-2 [Bacillus amyloliquefaciens]
MAKMRVYEYAKAINVSSKEILTALKNMDIVVNNHMATLEEKTIKQLDAKFKKGGAGVKSQKPAETNKNKQPQGVNQQPAGNQPNKIRDGKKNDVQNNQFNKNKKNNNNNKNKNKRNHNNKNQHQQKPLKPKKELPEKITFSGSLTVGALAEELGKEPSEIIKKLMLLGVMATINQELDKDTIELIASEYGVETEEVIVLEETELEKYEEADKEEDLQIRPPVVTIMGHVDHGKTTLLDSIRKTKVVEGEAGGITQHIGAYQIEENGKKITFLDTPGHAAFTTMRARGAEVTDITILVVAADDGVMPQTVEAINHAKAAEVPIIVAVNKVDKESANPDRVMQELTEYGLVPEAWGGETIFVPLSALTGKGIDELVEMILLVSEVEELKANPNRQAKGTVIEAELDKGRGSVATLLVQTGTLQVGDPIVVGNTFGRVRAMVNDLGRRVKTAGPSTPVEITGLNDVPQAGDQFLVFKDEKTARSVGEARASKQLEEQRSDKAKLSLDDLFEQIKQGDVKDINLIVKADVQGSAEALTAALQKIEVEGVKVKIIHTGVGAITESDIILASASNAIVIGFNVRPDGNAKSTAEAENVDIRLHRIIYKVIEEIEAAMKGMLDPEYEEKVIGQVEVRQTFKVSKIGTIAGGYVTDGHITRDSGLRLIRDGVVIFEGEVDVLKRFKDDVKEVSQGYECGITIKKYNDIREGDILEAYVMQEIERK